MMLDANEAEKHAQSLRDNWALKLSWTPELVDFIRYERGFDSRWNPLMGLALIHRSIAGYEYCLEHQLDAFKQHIHVSTLCHLRMWSEPTNEPLFFLTVILDALLSDNLLIMQEVAGFEHPELQAPKPSSGEMETLLSQYAILGRDDLIAQALERIAAKGNNADRKEFENGHNFFDCLLKQDLQALTECILRTAKTPFAKNAPYFGHFMHKMATAQAKLCHLRGLLVEIDHPLVPMDIVRVAPLPQYDNVYDFLEPGFVPLKPTLKDRWRFFIRQRAQKKA
jgi:hypothetical protein